MTNGYVTNKAYLGISAGTLTAQMARQYRYDISEGVFIYSVDTDGAADRAGLQMGDVITKIGERSIASYEDLVAAKKGYSAGDTATFTIYRQGKTMTVELTFDSAPQDALTEQDTTEQNGSYGGGGYYYNPWSFFNDFFGYGYNGSSADTNRDAA